MLVIEFCPEGLFEIKPSKLRISFDRKRKTWINQWVYFFSPAFIGIESKFSFGGKGQL